MRTIMFFTPHPDDIELGCPFAYLEALRLGYRVIEVVMTNGEFGTERLDFKGARLVQIRKKEIRAANMAFERQSRNQVQVVWMGYVDGYLPLNNKSLKTVSKLILNEKPSIIFGPDPIFPQDYHPDHLNTGKLIYYSLFKLKQSELPRVLYYYSTRTQFYLKCRWEYFKIVQAALHEHKSQYSPLAVQLIMGVYNKVSILRHLLERGSFSESFREQKYVDGVPVSPKRFNFYERVLYYAFSTVTLWGVKKLHSVTPEDVGLNRNAIYK